MTTLVGQISGADIIHLRSLQRRDIQTSLEHTIARDTRSEGRSGSTEAEVLGLMNNAYISARKVDATISEDGAIDLFDEDIANLMNSAYDFSKVIGMAEEYPGLQHKAIYTDAFIGLGNVQSLLGDYGAAVDSFDKVVGENGFNPRLPEGHILYAKALIDYELISKGAPTLTEEGVADVEETVKELEPEITQTEAASITYDTETPVDSETESLDTSVLEPTPLPSVYGGRGNNALVYNKSLKEFASKIQEGREKSLLDYANENLQDGQEKFTEETIIPEVYGRQIGRALTWLNSLPLLNKRILVSGRGKLTYKNQTRIQEQLNPFETLVEDYQTNVPLKEQ